ncbi:MAG: TetR/AcrR family transcriptional regulator [Deltaproteobacteria bacterium]|nr:TetR/AcrR family transcriptional regulator [Deltaproteobacteria bacterium]MBT4264474.1 TetR/AcrR family transcriptional regulator [Deltaproteobacteria bacterium]MBT6498721.1 TetR/AcrR family transcriptional regulator [Deltaproteobacteria bacterium]
MNRRDKSKATKRQILRAAEKILAQKGLDATITEIASAAGVHDSIIYYYFKNKEDLMFSVVGESSSEAMARLEKELKGIRDPLSRLSKFIWFHLNRIDNEPDFSQITVFQCRSRYSYYDHDAFQLHLRQQLGILRRIIREGINRGDFDETLNVPVVLNMIAGIGDIGNLKLRLGQSTGLLEDDFDHMMDLVEPVVLSPTNHSRKATSKASRILQAAEKVFGEKGYDRSTIQDVVNEAKVAEGSAYWYFKSKDELLYSSFIEGFRRSADDFSEFASENPDGPKSADSVLQRLERFLKNLFMIAVKHPAFSKNFVLNGIYNRGFYDSRAYASFKEFVDQIHHLVELGIREGVFRKEVNLRLFENMTIGTFYQSVSRWHIVDHVSWHSILYDIEDIVAYLLRAIKTT